jgi:hypothetical protein
MVTMAPDQKGEESSFSKVTADLVGVEVLVIASAAAGPRAIFFSFAPLFGSLTEKVYSRSLMETDSTWGSFSLSAWRAMNSLNATWRSSATGVRAQELPDRQEHHDQQDPEQERLVRLLH